MSDCTTHFACNCIQKENDTLRTQLQVAIEALEFYADVEKMYDTAFDCDGKVVGYVRGIDPYDSSESDFSKINGMRSLHHGKRARESLEKYRLN